MAQAPPATTPPPVVALVCPAASPIFTNRWVTVFDEGPPE